MAERRGSFFTSKPPTATRSQIDRVSEMLKVDKKWFGALSAEQQNAVVAVMIGDEKKCDLNNGELKAVPKGFLMLCPGVESLELQNNELTELPDTLGALANLRTLRLSFNKLTKLPSEGTQMLGNLQTLQLYDNALSRLPDSVCALTQLKHLSVGVNKLGTLPEQFGRLVNLKELYLDFNVIARLPESFGYLASLELLFLNNNKLTQLPRSFIRLQKLRKLNLQRNDLQVMLEVSAFDGLTDVYVDDPGSRTNRLLSKVFGGS